MKIIKVLTIIILCIIIVCAGWFSFTMQRFIQTPAPGPEKQIIFAVAPGEGFDQVATRLVSKGIITSTIKFKLLALWKGDDKKLKAGEFILTSAATPLQVLDALVRGKTYLYRLTIPEGYNASQIADEVAAQGLGDSAAFMALVENPQTAQELGIKAKSLEGYLFPDTYFFPKSVTTRTIIQKMVTRFKEQFEPAWTQRCKELNLSVHEIVTLASIIEKETGVPEERPIISSVFHNRLKKKMRLESDPTVIYGIKDFDGNITRRHLKTPTPYNTYTIKGLPPGPIASPGKDAIKAALYPQKTNFLFFVSKQDNTHHFSTTIQEHNRAVRKYQLRHRRKPTG